MRKVFEVEAVSENGGVQLNFPAEPYVLLDALEKLRLEPGEAPRWELFGVDDDIFQHLDQDDGSLAELNALTQRFAALEESEVTIFEGLAAMERVPMGQRVPLSRLIDLAYSTDCCHLVEGVVTDAQLGRFCAENGFIPETEGLSDKAFELLDFAKLGREFREAEGGVFTRVGYVQRKEELKQVYKTLDLTPKKPDYAMLAELPDGSRVELPAPLGETLADGPAQCVDCAAPVLNGLAGNLSTLDYLARRMAEIEADGEMTQYKALLATARCDDMIQALSLADQLDQYTLSPKLLEPEDAAMECLKTMLSDDDAELVAQYLDLRRYGEAVVAQDGGALTPYGLVECSDGQPVQDMEHEYSSDGMEMV